MLDLKEVILNNIGFVISNSKKGLEFEGGEKVSDGGKIGWWW